MLETICDESELVEAKISNHLMLGDALCVAIELPCVREGPEGDAAREKS
jgi:hypothetical protein